MHRFFKLRNITLQQLNVVSRSNFENNNKQIYENSCSLCKQCYVYSSGVLSRRQSTYTNPDVHVTTKRKRIRKNKNYAEILEVTSKSTKEARAPVKKLKPNDFNILAQEPEIGLSELHKIRTRSRFSSNNPVDPILTTVDAEDVDIGDHTELTHNNFLAENNENIRSDLSEFIEEESKSDEYVVPNKKEKEKLGKEEALNRVLGAHVDMCIAIGNPNRAFMAFQYFRNRAKKGHGVSVKHINIYNILLQGFASKGNIVKIKELLKIIQEDGLQLNVQSYVSIFECLAHFKDNTIQRKHIEYFSEKLSVSGITFDKIMNDGNFVGKQRNLILSIMHIIDPGYKPIYKPPNVQYTCKMLEELNCPEQWINCVDNKLEKPEVACLFSSEKLKDLTHRQLNIEINGYVKVKSIESRSEPSESVLQYREILDKLMSEWENVAVDAFHRGLDTLRAQPHYGSKTLSIEPYLRCLPVNDYIQVIINEVRRLADGSETYSPTVLQLYRDLGSKVYARYQVHRKTQDGVIQQICNTHDTYCDWYATHHGKGGPLNTRQKWQWIAFNNKEGASVQGDFHHSWPATTMIILGQFLYNIIMHDFKIDVNITKINHTKKKCLPAFYSVFRSQGRVVKEEVKPHPVVVKLFRASEPEYLTFPASEVPMICPPKPWISVTSGSYLVAHSEIVRLPTQAVQQWQRLTKALPSSLYPALDSLNQLASIPWKVNRPILDVILKVFNSGGSSKLDVPEPPSSCPSAPVINQSMTKSEKFQIFRQRLQVRRKKGEMYSLWCDALYRLSLANHFRNDIFWLPHNMDFRGRVYPMPPHLNHLGSDLARAMLVFAESKLLGPKGLDWLKIHVINLTGLKKQSSIENRLEYANEVIDDILDSADHPLTGKMWWANSDEPWQTLACCMEIANALRSPDPEKYDSHYPVHQDGSCNGLQHYAALGRDSAGAFSVNLVPANTPQDVYSAVATLVENQRSKDAANGIQIAVALDCFIKRKVIKQTVMTTVYGVTRFGARLQIARQLKDLDNFPKELVWPASTYLTSKTFESLRTMFTSTREIQDWFTECARLIAAVNVQNVEWITPLGLPVVQPYSRHRKVEHGKKSIPENFLMDMFERPNVMKQKNAFPPNFIHSLDSSHMMLTSLFCERAGITFVSVHDCFWTHPCSVHIMNKICREQFVALHSQPILEDLSKFLIKKYSHKTSDISDYDSISNATKRKLNKILNKLPRTGDFNLDSVLDSVYFFS